MTSRMQKSSHGWLKTKIHSYDREIIELIVGGVLGLNGAMILLLIVGQKNK